MESVTLREILNQPDIWAQEIICSRKEKWSIPPAGMGRCTVIFVGCGTSYYLAQSAAAAYTRLTRRPSRAVPGSEVFLNPKDNFSPQEKLLAVPISRSGTTTETVWAAQYFRKKMHVPVLSITCYPDSALAKAGNWKITLPYVQEKSVVMTGSFSSQLLAVVLAADPQMAFKLKGLPRQGEKLLTLYQPLIQALSKNPKKFDHFVFCGQGLFYGIANEAMLKMKEMTLSFSEAYHALEYRHGPKSIVTKKTLLTVFLTETGMKQEIRFLSDMKKLGARTLVMAPAATKEIKRHADYLIELGTTVPEPGRMFLAIALVQLFGYYRAMAKGINPDSPKNLTQVVHL